MKPKSSAINAATSAGTIPAGGRFMFLRHLAVVRTASTLGFILLAAAPAIANWLNEIDEYQVQASDAAAPDMPNVVARVPGLRFSDRPFNLQLRIGASTSVGELGIVAEYDLHDRINVGFGLGTNVIGLMPGAHLRLRPIVSRNMSGVVVHAVLTELSMSRGIYSGSLADGVGAAMCQSCDADTTYMSKAVWWGQAEVGWEARWANGLLLRASTGIAVIIAEPPWHCTKSGAAVPCAGSRPTGWVEAYTFAVGYAF